MNATVKQTRLLTLSGSGSPHIEQEENFDALADRQLGLDERLELYITNITYAFGPQNGNVRIRQSPIQNEYMSGKVLSVGPTQEKVVLVFEFFNDRSVVKFNHHGLSAAGEASVLCFDVNNRPVSFIDLQASQDAVTSVYIGAHRMRTLFLTVNANQTIDLDHFTLIH